MVDENTMIRTIVLGSDWQEVLENIIIEDGIDPLNIDIVALGDAFYAYLQRLQSFDFRIPARFILIASILLRLKCELMLEEEEVKEQGKDTSFPKIDVQNLPELSPPILRKPTRKVTFAELVKALSKAIDFREEKETRIFRLRRAVETLIQPEEDIEARIEKIYKTIVEGNIQTFSSLVPEWKRITIVRFFLPLLHLMMRDKILCNQPELFGEIFIQAVGPAAAATEYHQSA